jgi:hypothetical protein
MNSGIGFPDEIVDYPCMVGGRLETMVVENPFGGSKRSN